MLRLIHKKDTGPNCKECHIAIKVLFGEYIDNTHFCNLIRECLSNRYRKQSFPFLIQPDDYTSPWGNHSNHNSHEQHQNNQIVGFGCRSLQHPRSFQTSSINKLKQSTVKTDQDL